jgi:K+-sensing histidine kinase KdpD
VAVGASPFSTRLIRWTRRMAYALDAPWIAVNVETPAPLPPEERKLLEENLALARELNAEIVVVPDRDVAGTLVRVAQQHNVSQIVIGKSRGRPSWISCAAARWPTAHPPQRPDRRLCRARRAAHRAQPVAGMDRLGGVAALVNT